MLLNVASSNLKEKKEDMLGTKRINAYTSLVLLRFAAFSYVLSLYI